jgi:tetratricopeptide (TPR) repeat protein
VGARYFAQRALELRPQSRVAAELLEAANAVLRQEAALAQSVQAGLTAVDSLLNYGRVDRAQRIARGLAEVAPNDPNVTAAVRRAQFEVWRARAATAYADSDWPTAVAALDSALGIYPGHAYCVDLQQQISRLQAATQQAARAETVEPDPISPELRRDVAARYASARDAFERGDLETAIARWEEVERLAPGFESVRAYLVKAYKFVGVERYGQNQLEDAIQAWSRAAELEPANTEIASYMRRAQAELRKLRELTYEP